MNPYILAETNWKTLKYAPVEVAILPWGATEAHNYHLPYGTDNIETEKIVAESARKAIEKGARVIVLPGIPFGVNTGQLDIRININMNPSTQYAILKDITDVLSRHGINKFLIVNGHGGNDFRQMIRELGACYPAMFIATCNWYQAIDQSLFFEEGGGHADEMETSLMLYLAPDLVLSLDEAGKGSAKKFRVQALNEKWAWSERKWTKVTEDTGIGDPSKASREKGEKYFKAVTDELSKLILDLDHAKIQDMYI